MTSNLGVVPFVLVAAFVSMSAGCGGGKVCKDNSSFNNFLESDWRTYCEAYSAHVEAPSNYSLGDLTMFLSGHSERVKALNKDLYQHEKYETCFETPKAELELRELQTCLQDNDQSDIEITNAWSALADPWIEDLRFRVQEVSPRVGDAEREATRVLKKVAESFDFHTPVEGRPWESLQVELKSIDKALVGIEGVDTQFEKVAAKGTKMEALNNLMVDQYAPPINAIAADVTSLRGRHDELMKTSRYLEFAASSAGVKCPKSARGASKELRIAKKIVKAKNSEVGGSGARILTKTRADAQGDLDFERFEGHVCGIRGAENQFDGSPQLCGQYRFVVERQKPAGAKKRAWGDWALKSFEESGSSGGIDCALKKK